MEHLRFTRDEIRTVTLIAALVSIIGPLLVGFILDRVSVNRPASYGKWLRVLLFICFIAAGILFPLLLIIERPLDMNQKATFSCEGGGGHLFVSRQDRGTCDGLNVGGSLELFNCSYTCELPENFKHLNHALVANHKSHPAFERLREESTLSSEAPLDEDDYDENRSYPEQPEALVQVPTEPPLIPPPHICVSNGTNVNCHVYLDGVTIKLNSVEKKDLSDDDQVNFSDNWCKHPLGKKPYKKLTDQLTITQFIF